MDDPSSIEIEAVSFKEPSHLVQILTGAILGCGGWVLSRGQDDTGAIYIQFQFKRQACMEIYCILLGSGLELSQSAHARLTEICQSTMSRTYNSRAEVASIYLEIRPSPKEMDTISLRFDA
jgi:hypothetical protein